MSTPGPLHRGRRELTSPIKGQQRGETLEEQIASVAAGQHGAVTRAQLLELGMSPSAVGRRLGSGRLRSLHRGVYLVGPLEPDGAAEMAAVLAGGPAALLSHTNALRRWGLLAIEPPRPVHVTIPGGGRSRRPGIVFHQVGTVADDERTLVEGIPITTPARTIVDAAGTLGSREVELSVAMAEREGIVGTSELAALPDRYPRRPGMPMLRALLRDEIERPFTRSEAERKCLALIRDGGLARPHTNVAIGPYELDLFWPGERVAVEVDGWKYHSSRARFEGDRRKDSWLRSRGIEVIRVSWRQITRYATATAVQVGQALALARARQLAAARRLDAGRLPEPSEAPPNRPVPTASTGRQRAGRPKAGR